MAHSSESPPNGSRNEPKTNLTEKPLELRNRTVDNARGHWVGAEIHGRIGQPDCGSDYGNATLKATMTKASEFSALILGCHAEVVLGITPDCFAVEMIRVHIDRECKGK